MGGAAKGVWLETATFFGSGIEMFHRETGRWFILNFYPFKDIESDIDSNDIAGTVLIIHDTTEIKQITEELELKNREIEEKKIELEDAYAELKATQAKLLHQEKMASIGQLAAGVAHEINNPMGFIISNLSTLGRYVDRIVRYIDLQSEFVELHSNSADKERLDEERQRLKIAFVIEDMKEIVKDSLEGAERVKEIVQNLKGFARVDEAEFQLADINECLESTINIVWNEIKYKATLKKGYGNIPLTRCYPKQLNQVFMNILINAVQAIEDKGEITVRTWEKEGMIHIAIEDTGCGIPEEDINRIFDPFFTRKEVGKGTGLGLSIAHDIVKKHGGEIMVESEVGKGTKFIVKIPVAEPEEK